MQNRYMVWELERETVQLQCFRSGNNVSYVAEAIAVHPTEPRLPAPDPPVDPDARKSGARRSP
jgi:hypothetical protein